MFRDYLGMEDRYAESFVGGWYKTGDIAERDEDGYYWFVGRGDDVIKSSGHLIGPFEVESALIEHEAVAEAGVIGKPDPVAGEVVKAFVALNVGYEWSRELEKELIAWGRVKLGASRGTAGGGAMPGPSPYPFRQNHAATAQGVGAGLAHG
jgi:acetyl-CoA synthetase